MAAGNDDDGGDQDGDADGDDVDEHLIIMKSLENDQWSDPLGVNRTLRTRCWVSWNRISKI